AQVGSLQGPAVGAKDLYLNVGQLFFESDEYSSHGATDVQFVTDLYRAFLNRQPEPAGLAIWTNALASGMPRDQVMLAVKYSPEADGFAAAIAGPAGTRAEASQIVDYYVGFLGRLPDPGGLSYWLSQVQAAQCSPTPASTVLAS